MDIQEHLAYFTKRHPEAYRAYTEYGKALHENGPLPETTRWLIKVAVSATEGYSYSLTTHIRKALKAGCTPEEIEHALVLIAPTAGFPRMMEALLHLRQEMEAAE